MSESVDEAKLEIIDVRLEIDIASLEAYLQTIDTFPIGNLQK